MANLTFADTHNMVVFLSKSNVSVGFDQIVDFLNAQVIQYALMVNPTIYVSCIKQFWATASIKRVNDVVKLQALIDRKKNEFSCSMASAVICLATGRNFNFSKYIFYNMVRNVDSPIYIPCTYPKVFGNMRRVGKGFSRVETPLFATMLVQPQSPATEEEDEVEVPAAPTPPSPTIKPIPPPQEPTTTPPQAQPAPLPPPQAQP
uniref:Xylulose kinase-1 n=1 Tax=Tanacetum cinerariifolium TaxID=118510 RepID=A0A699J4B7_TANCI|nr:hypothetical protein [Tanacetum cinerariifolium]